MILILLRPTCICISCCFGVFEFFWIFNCLVICYFKYCTAWLISHGLMLCLVHFNIKCPDLFPFLCVAFESLMKQAHFIINTDAQGQGVLDKSACKDMTLSPRIDLGAVRTVALTPWLRKKTNPAFGFNLRRMEIHRNSCLLCKRLRLQ